MSPRKQPQRGTPIRKTTGKSVQHASSFGIHTYEGNSYRKRNLSARKRRIVTITVILLVVVALIALLVYKLIDKDSNRATEALSTKASSSDVSTTKALPKPTTSEGTTEVATTKSTEPSTTTSTVKNAGMVSEQGLVTFTADNAYKQGHTYCVAVNRQKNVVTVYGKDSKGEFTKPVKAMLCSCGIGGLEGGVLTPTGTFNTSRKDRWLLLVGNCWGQYTTKVYGSIFFHSIPYYTQNSSDLQYEEFPKLGSAASHGCIRLSTADAKWIYDNLELGGMVFVYDSNVPGPLGKPANVPFDVNSPNKGWDPTDPDKNNPWNQ